MPVDKVLKAIEEDMYVPFHWGIAQPGMQAQKKLTDQNAIRSATALWKQAGRYAIARARDLLNDCGLHKQVINRIVEPWTHIDVIVTATNYDNFLGLRCHPDADPVIRALAWRMADALYLDDYTPQVLKPGEWHLPYVTEEEKRTYDIETMKKCSVARCARVSYRNHDGSTPVVEKDVKLWGDLLAGLKSGDPFEPGHLSPFEHQATPLDDPNERSGNFRGWKQHRKEFEGETVKFNYGEAVARGWRTLALEGVP